jgi:hypothetical protein
LHRLSNDEWTINPLIPDRPRLVHMLMGPAPLQQVQEAADARAARVAAWERQAIRQITPEDFPARWHAGDLPIQSHESGYFRRKFGLRLDEVASRTLERLTNTFHRSAAEIIRQLIAQVALQDFPQSW